MKPAAFVLLNPRARGGTACERYRRVEPMLGGELTIDTVSLDAERAWEEHVGRAIDGGVRLFVAAGGDGTVGALATALVARRREVPLEALTLGAIGLGSSNDFHKTERGRVWGASAVPLRIDAAAARLERPMLVTLLDDRGALHTRTSVVSASVGLVARGNLSFNRGGPVLAFLKRRWTDGAVALAALDAAFRSVAVPCQIVFDDERTAGTLTNLSVGRGVHIGGPFAYEPSQAPSSEHLRADALWTTASTASTALAGRWIAWAALGILLVGGRLSILPQRVHRWTRTATVHADAPFDLEVDGETARATAVTFTLAPESLRLCSA